MQTFKDFQYNGCRIVVKESKIARGNQFKALVNGISLGCLVDEATATAEAIRFADKLTANATK